VQSLVLAALDRDFFRVRLDRLTPKEREYLRAMADLGPGPIEAVTLPHNSACGSKALARGLDPQGNDLQPRTW
jgi:hypothetical protein